MESTQMRIFKNDEFGSLKAMMISGNPWFVGKDVASILGYADSFGAIKKHVDDEDKQNCQNDSFKTPRGMTIINESGLYSLILSSKLPSAKRFKHWVTSEVLPSIRKSGGYIDGQDTMSDTDLLAKAVLVATKQIEERNKRIEELTSQNMIMAPKAEYYDHIVDTGYTTCLRVTAKELGVPERYFMASMIENKILYRDRNNVPFPYAQYVKDGWFRVKDLTTDKYATYQTRVTPKGKAELRKILKA